MTEKEVKAHPAFLRLSESHQKFVTELMTNGNDKINAAHATWNCKNDAVAEAMANKASRKVDVKFLMDAFLGVDVTKTIPSRDELAAFAWSKTQKAGADSDAYKWASMVAQVMGYNTKPTAVTPETASTTPTDDSNEEFAE